MEASTAAGDSASPTAEESPEAEAAPPAADAAPANRSGTLSASAPAFVPGAIASQPNNSARERGLEGEETSRDNLLACLPDSSLQLLRRFYTTYSGEYVAYYVGCLKSFNTRNGYGFIDCSQSKADFGADVFIHKNLVPNPWHIGQPVEFAVACNSRGQPQAADPLWLPALPPSSSSGSNYQATRRVPVSTLQQNGLGSPAAAFPLRPPGPARRTPAAMDADAAAGGIAKALPPCNGAVALGKELRRLGTFKSFSPASGYGFIACEELYQDYKRDVYFDKSQTPPSTGGPGWTVEFAVMFNASGQPQAHQIDWDPIPLMTLKDARSEASLTPNKRRTYAKSTLSNLKKLLQKLSESNVQEAIVDAMDLHGACMEETRVGTGSEIDGDRDVDYATFVLARLGEIDRAVGLITDVHRLLLLVMLAKMLSLEQNDARRTEHVRWFEALAKTVQPEVGKLKDVVAKIEACMQSHAVLQEEARFTAAFKLLQEKADRLPSAKA